MFPILMGVLGWQGRESGADPALPANLEGLLPVLAGELIFFGIIFALALAASRASASQLFLQRPGIGLGRLLGRGLLWSVALRLSVAIVTVGLATALTLVNGGDPANLEFLKPDTQSLINPEELLNNPVFLWMNLTVVSFVVAGFREELWRAGMLAGLFVLFPRLHRGWGGRLAAVGLIALLFGFGHLPQGLGGVLMTSVLGLGLGFILVWRRSLWEATLAHGFFDATTFALLYLLARFRPETLQTLTG